MNILITGGAGFIGSNFTYYWLEKHPKDKIKVLDSLTYAGNFETLRPISKKIEFIEADINNRKKVSESLKGIDTLVHFAAESHVDRSVFDPSTYWQTNVHGTLTLLEEAEKAGVSRFHHISCYDTKTRALTKDGLKTYKDIKKGDLVLSLNPETKICEWKPVEKVIVQDYKGKMIRMKSRVVDFLVTPNHRMMVESLKTKKFSFKEADLVKNQALNKLPKHYKWEGKVTKTIKQFAKNQKDFMYLLGIFIGDGFTGYQEKIEKSKTGLTRLEFLKEGRDKLGKFTTLGKVGNKDFNISQSWRIFMDIPENDKCRKRCEQSLTNLGINWHAQKGKAGEHLYFTSEKFFKIFEDCGKFAKNKKIPDWAIDSPVELLKPLWNGLMDSDGSKRRVFFTISPKLAEQFVELSVKLGFNPNLAIKHSKSEIEGRKIEGWSYVISIGNQWRIIRKEISSEVPYKDKIWCLKVKDNKNFLIERNGRTAFCGNTDEVYGELPLDSDLKFSEKTAYSPRPDNLYALSKAEADRIVMDFYQKTKMYITISNCSNNYGPFQFPEKFIPIITCNLIDNIKVPLHGDGRNVRDWIHTRDHSSAVETILEKGKKGETYLVGSNNDRSNGYIAKKMVNLYGADENMIKHVSDRHSNDRRYAIDATKITEELGWKPKIGRDDFNEGLKETIKWYKENEDWWRPLLKRKALIMDSTKSISAYISLERETGKTKFVFGKVEKNNDGNVIKPIVGKNDTEEHFVEQNLIRYEIVIRNLESRKWYQNSSESIKKEIKALGINPSTFGYVEDLAGREDHLDGDTILSLEKIEHGDIKYGIYGIGSWFLVENKKKEKRMEGYYSWGWGPKSGAKLLVLIKRKGEITHLATQRELKFPTGSIEYTLPGGLPTLNESVLDFIVRSLQKDLNLSVSENDVTLDQIISLGRLNPDGGMTNNKPNLYAVVVDLSDNLYTDVKKGDKFEEDEGVVLWPIDKLADFINKCDDAYFLSALTRLNLLKIQGLKLQ